MQVLAFVVAFIVLVVVLVMPLLARSATTTGSQNTTVQKGALTRGWPSKYPGATLQVKFSEALLTQPGFPAMDGASKDPAKMSITWQPESLKDFSSYCADVVVRAATPTGVGAEARPVADGNECVASMKVPADTPLTVHLDFSHANGWIQSVEGGHATSDVIMEKVGPDHIAHKHIAGVKWQDVIVAAGKTGTVKLLVYSYTPQLPAVHLP